MKHLILFDLHYQNSNPFSRKKLEAIVKIKEDFGGLILGGDNAELSSNLQNHRVLFDRLKRRFECPTGFVVGNHELWGRLGNISSQKLLNEIFPALAEKYNFVYLEQKNLDIDDISFTRLKTGPPIIID